MAPSGPKKTRKVASSPSSGPTARRRDSRRKNKPADGASAANTHDVSPSHSDQRPKRGKKSPSSNKGDGGSKRSPKTKAKNKKSYPAYNVGDRVMTKCPRYKGGPWEAVVKEVLGDDKYLLFFDKSDKQRHKIHAKFIQEKLSGDEESVLSEEEEEEEEEEEDNALALDPSESEAGMSDEDALDGSGDESDADSAFTLTKKRGRGGAGAKRKKSHAKSLAPSKKGKAAEVETPREVSREEAEEAGGVSFADSFIWYPKGKTPPGREEPLSMPYYFDLESQCGVPARVAERLAHVVPKAQALRHFAV